MVLKNETFAIIGACMEVHNTLGRSFSEKVYQDALEQEFILKGIPYEREKHILINYKGVTLAHDYFADFNYLHAANMQVGLLVNFRTASLTHERFINFDFK